MCRLLAYWGTPIRATSIVVDPPHALLAQCTAAREQTSGHENPDGWGFGWFTADGGRPERYRSTTPMPADVDGLARLAELTSDRFIAHIRHKSPGSPTELAGNAPFVEGGWMFAHNGFVEGYRKGVREQLHDRLTPRRAGGLQGDADSEVLFALVLDRLDAGDSPTEAVIGVISALAPTGGKYNVVLTDGRQLIASRWGNSLHLRRGDPAHGSVVVASEPYDDGEGWQPIPDHSLVCVDARGVDVTPLGPTPAEAIP
jgi:gamma-glutamyl hercynylcysteine S-oxide hydrolase